MSDRNETDRPKGGETTNSGAPLPPPDTELRQLLRRAMPDSDADSDPDLLEAVQQKLRLRSGGKFYADGWSVAKHPPISTYLITSLVMLAIVIALYAALFSFSGTAEEVDSTPAPIQVLPR